MSKTKYSTIIADFLSSHPLISANALEKKLNIPQSTLHKAISGARQVPAKHIFSLLLELAEYGLTIDGYRLSVDETDTLFAIKDVKTIESVDDGDGFYYITKQYRWFADSYADLL